MKVLKFVCVTVLFLGIVFILAGCGGRIPAGQAFVGEWTNVDPATLSITRIIFHQDDDTLTMQVWGACFPTDCDWSEAGTYQITEFTNTTLTAVWDLGFSEETMNLTLLPDGQLQLSNRSHDLTNPDGADMEFEAFFNKVQ